MNHLIYIFTNIMLPVFIQIGLGYWLQKKFKIGVEAPVRILLYLIIPAVLFTNIYSSSIENNLFVSLLIYSILHYTVLYIIGRLISRLSGYSSSATGAFVNSVMFYNSANYCLPLIELIFNDPYAISLLTVVIMVSSTLTYSVGVVNASISKSNLLKALVNVFKLPTLYSILAAFIFRWLNVDLWAPLDSTLQILSRGLVPISLVTLGAQLALTSFELKRYRVYISNFIRLVISPVVAFVLVLILGIEGMPAQVILIASAAPTAINTIVLSIEYKNEPDFCSQAVFTSTLLSAVTVSATIYLAQILF